MKDPNESGGWCQTEWITRCIEITDATLARPSNGAAEAFAHREFADAQMAAKDGSALAQYRVAECYLIGHGVTRDVLTGYAWMWIAAEAGSDEAERCLAEADLTDDQQAMVLTLVTRLKPVAACD